MGVASLEKQVRLGAPEKEGRAEGKDEDPLKIDVGRSITSKAPASDMISSWMFTSFTPPHRWCRRRESRHGKGAGGRLDQPQSPNCCAKRAPLSFCRLTRANESCLQLAKAGKIAFLEIFSPGPQSRNQPLLPLAPVKAQPAAAPCTGTPGIRMIRQPGRGNASIFQVEIKALRQAPPVRSRESVASLVPLRRAVDSVPFWGSADKNRRSLQPIR